MKSRIYIKRQFALQIIIYRMKQVLINMMDDEVKKDTSIIIEKMEMYFEYFPKIRSIYGFFHAKEYLKYSFFHFSAFRTEKNPNFYQLNDLIAGALATMRQIEKQYPMGKGE